MKNCTSLLVLIVLFILSLQVSPAQGVWTSQTSGVSTELTAVKAVGSTVAWVGGTNGVVLRTADAGSTWASVGGGAIGTSRINSIAATSDSIALVATTPSTTTYIFRTTNAGASWTQAYSLDGGFINAIWMINPAIGFAVGDPVGGKFVVVKTTDGGLNWTRLSNEPSANANEYGLAGSLSIRDGSYIWFGTNNGRVIFSTDQGATWTSATTPLRDVNSVWFNSSSQGFVAGLKSDNTPACAQSSDGGSTWQATTGSTFRSVGDGYQRYYAFESSIIYVRQDFNSPWTFAYGATNILNDISIGYAGFTSFGWAVGKNGTIAQLQEVITKVIDISQQPNNYYLEQNFPNPFNPSTRISYKVPVPSHVRIIVFNILGQKVATLIDGKTNSGKYAVTFNGSNLSTGLYIYKFEANNHFESKKMLLLR